MKYGRKRLDLTGQRFARLIVVSRAPDGPNNRTRWNCLCDCGATRVVPTISLRCGNTRSCGCLKTDLSSARFRTHGLSCDPLYDLWLNMHARCANPEAPGYCNYGGRGIRVCERWGDFAAFRDDMSPRPSLKHSIDRIDNDGPYSPENCRWATRSEQMNNTSVNRLLTFEGRTQTVTQWARERGLQVMCLRDRLKHGWSVEEALTIPVLPRSVGKAGRKALDCGRE